MDNLGPIVMDFIEKIKIEKMQETNASCLSKLPKSSMTP
jgi:hypothetical protein